MTEVYNVYQGSPYSFSGGRPIYGLNKVELFKLITLFKNGGGSELIVGKKIDVKGSTFDIYKANSSLGDFDKVQVYYEKMEKATGLSRINELFFNDACVKVTRKIFEEYEAELGTPQEKPTAIDTVKMIAKKSANRKIFVSHSSIDKDLVSKFVDTVLILGMGVKRKDIFYSSGIGTGIKSGEDFKKRIESELAQAKAVIQILTPNYKESEVCLNEMGAAWTISDIVIPLIGPPYNYDIGFIHHSNHQLKLNSHDELMQIYDDHKKKLFDEHQKTAVLNSKIKEFIDFLDGNKGSSKGKYFVY